MRIVQLIAKGFMGLELIEVELSGHGEVIEVHGQNGNGKSRFLDIIAVTMGGTAMRNHIKDARTTGGKTAECTVVTDNGYTITRKWKKNGSSSLTVFSEEDGMIERPADYLKRIVGEISFDPMSFANMQPRDQKAYLMELSGLEEVLSEIDNDKQISLGIKKKAKDDVVIEEMVLKRSPKADKSKLIEGSDAYINIGSKAEEIEYSDRSRCGLEGTINMMVIEAAKDENDLEHLKAKISDIELKMDIEAADLEEVKASLSALPCIDTLRQEFEDTLAHNIQIDIIKQNKVTWGIIKGLEETFDDAVDKVKALEEKRQKALEDAEFPIDGLGFDDEGITFNGIPFSQVAQSERLRVAMRIAIAKNPELKVIRVNDASLLDEKSIEEMNKLAQDEGYQFFLELVGGDGSRGIYIEEGAILEDAENVLSGRREAE